MNSNTNFLNKPNVDMLWEVISDEDIFKNQPASVKNNILELFSNNIKAFYEKESFNKLSIMEMNKKFILLILFFIKTKFPLASANKIVIHEEPTNISVQELPSSITSEERKQERMNQFDKELDSLKEEFKNAVTIPVPKTPNFSDNIKDKPITEMERAIKEMAEQRKYEIDEINKNYKINENGIEWLQSEQTSLKPVFEQKDTTQYQTKENSQPNNNNNNNNNNNKLRHIKWADQENSNEEEIEEKDLFAKLKPIKRIDNNEIERNRIAILEENVKIMNSKIEFMNTTLQEILQKLNK